MRKTIVTLVGCALIAASATQMAAAAQPHRSHKADRAPVTTTEQFRDSNAGWPAAQPLRASRTLIAHPPLVSNGRPHLAVGLFAFASVTELERINRVALLQRMLLGCNIC
jgi:hypothetical protein